MADSELKVAATLVMVFGGGVLLGWLLAPKGVSAMEPEYEPLSVPTCDTLSE